MSILRRPFLHWLFPIIDDDHHPNIQMLLERTRKDHFRAGCTSMSSSQFYVLSCTTSRCTEVHIPSEWRPMASLQTSSGIPEPVSHFPSLPVRRKTKRKNGRSVEGLTHISFDFLSALVVSLSNRFEVVEEVSDIVLFEPRNAPRQNERNKRTISVDDDQSVKVKWISINTVWSKWQKNSIPVETANSLFVTKSAMFSCEFYLWWHVGEY